MDVSTEPYIRSRGKTYFLDKLEIWMSLQVQAIPLQGRFQSGEGGSIPHFDTYDILSHLRLINDKQDYLEIIREKTSTR